MVSVFLVKTISSYPPKFEFPAVWSSSTMAAALCMDRSCVTQAFTQGVARASISFSLITFMTCLIIGVPKITGTCTMKSDKSGITGLFGPHHSPGFHPLEPIWPCSLKVRQMHSLDLHRWLICWLGLKVVWLLGSGFWQNLVWLCLSIVEKGHTALPINPYPGHVLTPYHCWKGSGFKKGVCVWPPMPWTSCPGVPLVELPFLEGSRLPSLALSPLCSLNLVLFWPFSPTDNPWWNDLGWCSDNNISCLAVHHSQL